MFVITSCIFYLLLRLVCSTETLQTVYHLQESLEIPVVHKESFVICPVLSAVRDWPFMVFGHYLVNVGYDVTNSLGFSEPSFKVHTRWLGQSDTESVKQMSGLHDSTSLIDFHITAFEADDSKNNEIIQSNNSKVFFTLPPTPNMCFMIFDIQPTYKHSGRLKISSALEFDRNRLVQSSVGLLIVICSNSLANSIVFYYLSGVSIIVFCCLLLIIMILIKMMPMRRVGAMLQGAVFFLGGTLGLTFVLIKYLRSVVFNAMMSNWEFVFGYVSVVSICSFVILYWLQVPDKLIQSYPRTKIITTIFLRLTGSLLFVYSMRLPVVNFSDLTFLKFIENRFALSGIFEALDKYSDLLIRVCMIFCVNIITTILQRHLNHSKKPESFSKISVQNQVFNTPHTCQHYMPGSPWAASSPCYHDAGFVSEKDTSYGLHSQFSDYNVMKSTPWTSEHPSIHKRQSYVSRRESQHLCKYEILTDDED
uniref:Intimal thickness related receptor IRP domain-containing protein n=1 Tax=Trichobilharzia regenti TaxID=157069 RepID=A0AA85KB07_TRIRE|nr:unnamed protein product [Trichobilharzia regenti]